MLKKLKIITNPNPILRKKSSLIDIARIREQNFLEMCENMAQLMLEKDGVGLAAPQIGKNIRLVVISTKDGILFLINPIITKKSWSKDCIEEGCLSLPGIFGKVQRSKNIKCIYTDFDGHEIEINANGLMARVIQHEVDHLDGILFIDTAKNIHHSNN